MDFNQDRCLQFVSQKIIVLSTEFFSVFIEKYG